MGEQSSQFVGSIPENYDQALGPHILHDYADDLAKRASGASATDILELASGTGILTRKLRNAVAPTTRLVATDLNPPMLDVGKTKFTEGEQVEFKVADAMQLPFEDNEFDLIVCQFGVMFFPDKPASFKEAQRVLRSGGRYLFNVWGSMSENPFSECAHNVGAQYFPDDPPGFYKVPFGYTDKNAIMDDMQAAGLENVSCENVAFDKEVEDWSLFARGLVHGNPLIAEINDRGGVDPEAVEASILATLRQRFGNEPSSMPLLATIYEGTAA